MSDYAEFENQKVHQSLKVQGLGHHKVNNSVDLGSLKEAMDATVFSAHAVSTNAETKRVGRSGPEITRNKAHHYNHASALD